MDEAVRISMLMDMDYWQCWQGAFRGNKLIYQIHIWGPYIGKSGAVKHAVVMAVFATAIDATSSGSLIRGPLLFLRFKLENAANLSDKLASV